MNRYLSLKALIWALCVTVAMASYDKHHRIVVYYDEIYVYPKGDNSTLEMDVAMFPFSQPYKNVS